MLIIVTGAVGIGKTTVCRKIIEETEGRGLTSGGIITYKAADGGIIVRDLRSGGTMDLANIRNVYNGPRTGKYFFNPGGINFGLRALEQGIDSTILVADEVGYLELEGKGFFNVFELVGARKHKNNMLVIRSELLSSFLPRFGEEPLIFETTINNRNHLPREIASVFLDKAICRD